MSKHNVNILDLKSLKAFVNSFTQMFSACIVSSIYVIIFACPYFCWYHDALSIDFCTFKILSKCYFSISCLINFRCVKKVNTLLDACPNQLLVDLLVLWLVVDHISYIETKIPNEITETFSPEFPKLRYIIFDIFNKK